MLKNSEFLTFKLPLFLILVGAAVLRAIGVHWGLPMAFHNDEPVLVLASQQFFTGDFNPHNFLYPSLLMYVMHVVHRIYALFIGHQPDLSTLYILARLTVGAFGLASILVTAIIGKKVFGKTVGLIAGLVVAVTHLHVVHSHFATTDIPLTFFILLTLYFALRLAETGRMSDYLLTGVAYGLAVSTKIPGAVILVPIVVAHLYNVQKMGDGKPLQRLKSEIARGRYWVLPTAVSVIAGLALYFLFFHFDFIASTILGFIRIDLWIRYYDEIVTHASQSALKYGLGVAGLLFAVLSLRALLVPQLKKLLLLIAVSIIVFFLTTPYAILDFTTFARDFLFQMVISQTTWSGRFADYDPAFITNFKYLVGEFGLPFILCTLAGMISILIKPRITAIILLLGAFVYYSYLGTWKIMFDRYMVPMVPFVSLFGVWGLFLVVRKAEDWFRSENRKYPRIAVKVIALGFFVLLLQPMLSKSVKFDLYLLKKNTKTIAYEWAAANLPKDAKILREQYAPELELAGFDVHNVNFTFNDSVNVNYVARNRIDYIIVTDKLWNRPILDDGVIKRREAYDHIEDYAELIYHIKPSKPHPGPEIKIYRTRISPKAELSGETKSGRN